MLEVFLLISHMTLFDSEHDIDEEMDPRTGNALFSRGTFLGPSMQPHCL
jgi:hypothetical protein